MDNNFHFFDLSKEMMVPTVKYNKRKSGKRRCLRKTDIPLKERIIEMKDLVQLLNNPSIDIVVNALATIRNKYFGDNVLEGIKAFRLHCGLHSLLTMISKPKQKSIDLALSILSDCCLEKESGDLVGSETTISTLLTILNSLDGDSIRNRTCTILSNLAEYDQLCTMIHKKGGIPRIVRFLGSTIDPNGQRSAIITLKKLARNAVCRESIVGHNGIDVVCSLLDTQNIDLLSSAVETLVHLTVSCHCCRTAETQSCFRRCGALEYLFKILSSLNSAKSRDKIMVIFMNFLDRRKSFDLILSHPNAFDILVGKLAAFVDKLDGEESSHEAENPRKVYSSMGKSTNLRMKRKNSFESYEPRKKMKMSGVDTLPKFEEEDETFVQNILKIMLWMSMKEKWHAKLTGRRVLDALLGIVFCNGTLSTTAAVILKIVAENGWCLQLFMTAQQVSLKLDDSKLEHSTDECFVCDNLCTFRSSFLQIVREQGESELGIAAIENLLLTGTKCEKGDLVVELPYLISSTSLLKSCFLSSNGLDLLLGILSIPSNKNFEMAVHSLIKIWSRMKVSSTVEKSTFGDENKSICEYGESEKNLNFVMDNGDNVYGNRDLLTSKSDVFAALLSGSFKEATQTEIKFGDAKKESFELIMHCLHGCVSRSCSSVRNQSCELVLDSLVLADRLLLKEVGVFIRNELVRLMIVESGNAVKIFEFGITRNIEFVVNLALNCVMGPSINYEGKFKFLEMVLNSNMNQDFLLEMKKQFEEHL